ncbi:hypothetical protein [Pontibacter ummariensis]|nr:hypothetical protein [Pontibacter ummariensis]
MKNVFLLFVILFLFMSVSCDKEEIDPETLNGTYTGYFVRASSPSADYARANVTLTLDNGKFSGSSNMPYYPAICRGTYSLSGHEIQFQNECFWTANFDWTYILDGSFRLSLDGDKLTITKQLEGSSIIDTYALEKQ